MDLGSKNKTALVLGGGGGLGRASAKALAAEGANTAVAECRKIERELGPADIILNNTGDRRLPPALGQDDGLIAGI